MSIDDIMTAALSQKEALDKALLEDKTYICFECGTISDYYKFGGVCERCEANGERQQEMDKGN